MRFNSIKIENYRQYRDLEIDFNRDKPCDIHLIIASNGVGKTNLLNAINWCLYGDEPHTSGGAEGIKEARLPLCNSTSIQETKDNGEVLCPVSVEIEAEDDGDRYIFGRNVNWNVNTMMVSGKDEFIIHFYPKVGDPEIFQYGQADAVINRFLPKKIRKYFYFDGEQLLFYFNPEKDRISHIKDSIYEIAGVNALQTVQNHLNDRIKDYKREIGKKAPDLDKKEQALQDAKDSLQAIEDEIAELNRQIKEAEIVIADIDRQINGAEGAVEKNRQYNRNKDEIEREKAELELAVREKAAFVRKYFPLICMYGTNLATQKYIAQRENDDSVRADVNVNLIKESIRKHECQLCRQGIPHNIEEELTRLIAKFEANTSLQKLAEIKNDINRSLDIMSYEDDKQRVLDAVTRHQDRIDALEDENGRLIVEIRQVSSIDQIAVLMDQKQANEELKEQNNRKLGSDEDKKKALEKELIDKQKDYDDAVEANKDIGILKKYLKFATDALEIVTETKDEIVDEVKREMEERTMDIFSRLVWKKDTYGRIRLDDNFQLTLYHKKTGQSCLFSCSAAEKELLALAFTIAIHQVSGYDNLLFIDTPVGRVSDENRRNFASVLLDISQRKQIVLAVTPSEYSNEVSDVLNSTVVSSIYNLRPTDSEDETVVG